MLEYYDLVPRWTDACPRPVLGAATGLAYMGMQFPLTLAAPYEFPGAGISRSIIALYVAWAIAAWILALLLYRCRPAGWYGTLAMILAGVILTFHIVPMAIPLAAGAGYMFYIRRYFQPATPTAQ